MPKPLFTTKPLASVISAITLGAMLLTSTNTWAQEEQKTSEKPEMPVKRLNTVKVSADVESSGSHLDYLKKENDTGALDNKTVLDTPFSITVVESDEIIERGAKSIGQIFVNDASVYAPTPSAQTDWWGTQIRGLPVRNFYVDDVPMLLYWGGDFPTEAAESVTALKGLTGFMYGFGEPGGAISYKIKRPTENPETFLNIGYRNPGLFSAHVDTSHNIGDEFALRTNLATEQGTSYNESDTDRTLVSLSLDKDFGESVNWFTNLIYEDSTLEAEPLQFYFSKYNAVSSNGKLPKINYDYDDLNVDNSYYHTETRILSTGVEWELSENWKLQYKIGVSRKIHQSNKSFAYLLNRQGDYEGYSYNFAGQLDNLFNQAILQGTISTGDIAHELVAGIGQQTSKEKWGTDWYWVNDFNGNIHQEQTFRITRTPDFSLESKPSLETDQSYAFASDTIHFNENWQAIIGLRFTDHKIKGTDFSTKETSPTLALIYKPDENTSFYGSYVQGFEPGSRIGPDYANEGELLDATVSEQYETGVKIVADKFNYTAAIFRIERASQIGILREDDVRPYLTQDGLDIYEGIELSTSYQFTDNLNLGIGALYLDGTLENVSTEKAELEGNDPAYASDWQVVGNFKYKLPAIHGLVFHGNARYFGESYTSTENTLKIPAYILVNAGVSYEFKIQNRLWKFNSNINNLLNEKYWAGGGWSSGNMGESRNISLGLNTSF